MASDPRSRRPSDREVRVRKGGEPSRDVRPVVALGLCLLAVILVWPLVRGEGAARPESKRPAIPPAPSPPARPADAGAPAGLTRTSATATGSNTSSVREVAPLGKPEVRRARAANEAGTDAGAAGDGVEEGEAPSGIGLFPPPGTDPPKAGILVPDDYELPPGYVRHYQTTDDGQQLRPILMFHPDFQPVDDRGRPIKLPKDRVVPPNLAPPGLPLETLQVPTTHVPLVEHPPTGPAGPAS